MQNVPNIQLDKRLCPMTAKCIKPKYFISDSKAVKTKQIGSSEKPKDSPGCGVHNNTGQDYSGKQSNQSQWLANTVLKRSIIICSPSLCEYNSDAIE